MLLAIAPQWLLTSPAASDRSIRLFYVLDSFKLRPDDWPTRRRLAELCRCSIYAVDRAIKTLVTLGAVTVTRNRDASGGDACNSYTLCFDAGRVGVAPVAPTL